MIDKIFKLKENKTNVKTELLAGITTFLAMSYVIFIIPSVLSQTGMDYESVYGATIIASVIGTLILGLFANVPYAQSAGLGLVSLFTYTICASLGYTWQEALAIMFVSSIINIFITITNIRKLIIESIPGFIQEAITVGIGLFIAYIGFIKSGIITYGASGVNNGFAYGVVPQLASFSNKGVLLAIIGLVITIILSVKKVKPAYLISILLTTIIGIPLGVTKMPDFTNYNIFPDITPTLFKLDLAGLFSAKSAFFITLMTIFTLCISDLFDSIGVFIGTGKKAKIFKFKDGKMPKKLEKAIMGDAIGTFFASLLGTSNITCYIESTSGIEAGGRTGLTSVFTALCFVLTLIFAPLIKCVPMEAIAPILIMVGASMLENIGKIDFKDMTIAIPAFFIIVMMPFGYSISTGIEFGFITYVIVNILTGKKEKIPALVYIFSFLFVLEYVFNTIL